jgi:dipeptidyl-peptidase-4
MKLIVFCLSLVALTPVVSQEKPPASVLTLERIFTDKEFEEEKMDTFQWGQLSACYYVLEKPTAGGDGKDLVKYNAATGERSVLIPAKAFIPADAKKPLTVSGFSFSKDEKLLLLFTNTKKVWRRNTRGDYWILDPSTQSLRQLGGDAAASSLMFAKFSADATQVAYVRENNLFVEDLSTHTIIQLTHDGGDDIINGTSDWVNEEELGLRDGFRWSPDGKQLLFWQFDTREVKRFTMVNQSDSKDQQFTTFPYPTAGETNSAARIGVVNTSSGLVRWLKIKGYPREHYLPRAEWTPDGKRVLVQQFNRLQNRLKLWLADPASREARPFFTEKDEAWVENKNEVTWIDDDLLWLSERSGWRHAYRVSLDGNVKAITKGKWDVVEVVKIDAANGRLYLIASPQNATQRYLYSVSLKDGKRQRLSPADQPGTHSYSISEDAAWAVHTYSTMKAPSAVQLISLPDHHTVHVIKTQEALKSKLAKIAMPKIEFFQVDIGDGILADGWMMSATDLDVSRKHPLLMHVYGEPAGQTVKDAWGGQRYLWHAMLAQQGYVLVSVDTRGTPAPKGREWRKAIYRRLGVLNSEEEATAVRALLERRPYLDSQRVGIWGWSGGGSSSLDALFRYPDLYHTAIAVAPVADRALYDSIYEERYMGLPSDNAEGYTDGSPITHARHLKGNLLLIHGTGDDNVHYRGTEMLMNELIAHNKAFTIMPYPNRDHSINTGKGISRHLYELMTNYLHQHLRIEPNTKP